MGAMRTDPAPMLDVTSADEPKTGLKRSLGLWMATALVVGNMIGSGIFLLPASFASVAGPVSILGLLFTAVGAVLLAMVFANLGRAFPRTGGPYAYARRAFGDFIGFQTAWGYWIAAWAGNAAIAVTFVAYAGVFWGTLGTNNVAAALVAIGIVWLLTLVNILGTRQGGIVQVATTVLKFVPLAIVALVGLFFFNADNFTPFTPATGDGLGAVWEGLSLAAPLALWAFIGLESATVPAGEVKDPKRTLPRATVFGTGITALIYIIATVAIMGVLSNTVLAGSTSPFADAAREIFGTGSGDFWAKSVALIAMISTFGCLNGWILLQGRVPLAAARDGLFPKKFGEVHGERKTPVFSLLVSSALISVLIMMNYNASLVDQFTFVILLATLTTLVPYAFSAAAGIFMYFHDRELFSGRKLAKDITIASIAFAYSVWAIYNSGYEVNAKGFLLLMLGIPVYLYMKYRESKDLPEIPPDLRTDHPTGATLPTTSA